MDTSSIQYESDQMMSGLFGSDYGIACCVSAMRLGKVRAVVCRGLPLRSLQRGCVCTFFVSGPSTQLLAQVLTRLAVLPSPSTVLICNPQDMQFFGARCNLPKLLLYIMNGGKDEVTGDQVAPAFPPLRSGDGPLNFNEVTDRLDEGMTWLAKLYCSTMNVIHYMHDKYDYERIQVGKRVLLCCVLPAAPLCLVFSFQALPPHTASCSASAHLHACACGCITH